MERRLPVAILAKTLALDPGVGISFPHLTMKFPNDPKMQPRADREDKTWRLWLRAENQAGAPLGAAYFLPKDQPEDFACFMKSSG